MPVDLTEKHSPGGPHPQPCPVLPPPPVGIIEEGQILIEKIQAGLVELPDPVPLRGAKLEAAALPALIGPRMAAIEEHLENVLGKFDRNDGILIGQAPTPQKAKEAEIATQNLEMLPVPHGVISRVHVLLRKNEADWTVADMGSSNGTFHRKPGESEWIRMDRKQIINLPPESEISLAGQFTFGLP